MKLYLSSYRMGRRFEELRAHIGEGAKVAVVSNALDYISTEARARYKGFNVTSHFRQNGLVADDLDLREYFGQPDSLRRALADTRLLWAVGGNAFLLRRSFRQSGLDDILRGRLADGSLIYGGWSAGAVVAGASLRGIHVMDNPPLAPPPYDAEIIWDGLGLVDFVIVPHFRSIHPETFGAEAAASWLKREGIAFQAIRDGDVIVR